VLAVASVLMSIVALAAGGGAAAAAFIGKGELDDVKTQLTELQVGFCEPSEEGASTPTPPPPSFPF